MSSDFISQMKLCASESKRKRNNFFGVEGSLRSISLFRVTSLISQAVHVAYQEKEALGVQKCSEVIPSLHQELPRNLVLDIMTLWQSCYYGIIDCLKYLKKLSNDKDVIILSLINMHWSTRKTVDTKETIKFLVKNASLSLALRYELSCKCCLESDILKIWYEMPNNQRKHYLGIPLQTKSKMNIVAFWTMYNSCHQESIKKIAANHYFENIYEFAFYHSVLDVNKDAARYFWFKVKPSNRRKTAFRALHTIGRAYRQNFIGSFHSRSVTIHLYSQIMNLDSCTYLSEIMMFIFIELGSQMSHIFLDNDISYGVYRIFSCESCLTKLDPIHRIRKQGISNTIFSNVILKVFVYRRLSHFESFNEIGSFLFIEMFQLLTSLHKNKIQPFINDYFNIFIQFGSIQGVSLIRNYCDAQQREELNIYEENIDDCKQLATQPMCNFLIHIIKKYYSTRKWY